MEIVLSFTEFVGVILGAVLLVILLYIVAYEYRLWRRRRLARALVRAERE